MLIDTHVHLNNDALYPEVETYLKKAREKGVERFVVIGYNKTMNERAIALAEKYPEIYAAVGVHPTSAKETSNEQIKSLAELINHPKVVAVGECGMDLYWDKDFKERQVEVFKMQIELAQTFDLPLSIHMRDATEITYETLKPYAPVKGIMHCYSGSAEMADKFLELGLHISLGGPVTFKNAVVPKEVAKRVPLDRILVETDAPFLAPHPYRGKQNDSSYLPLIANAIAELKNIDNETIHKHTTDNAIRLFKLE